MSRVLFMSLSFIRSSSNVGSRFIASHDSLQNICKRCFGMSKATSHFQFQPLGTALSMEFRSAASGKSHSYARSMRLLAWTNQRSYVTTHGPVSLKAKSPLAAKRPSRKKPAGEQPAKKNLGSITAYAAAEEILLGDLKKAILDQGLYVLRSLPTDAVDALYVRAKYAVDDEIREIFFFREGCAVFWNMPEVEDSDLQRREVLKFVQKYSDEPYSMQVVQNESDQMAFTYTDTVTSLVDDKFDIKAVEGDDTEQTLEKYAISNALAQSVKLAVMEAMLDRFVTAIEHVTEDLRDGKKISMSRREVLRRTGELFALRHRINLSSDLLDTPDFYWDRASLEPLYQKAFNNLNIPRRTRVMNERLNHCCELTELLTTHLNDVHHTRLEWMIIILIMVEVVFEVIHYIERFMAHGETASADRRPSDTHMPVTHAKSLHEAQPVLSKPLG